MSPALHRGLRKGIRTGVQLVAGGALTALVTAIAGGLSPATAAIVMGAWTVVVAAAQNAGEAAGKVPVLLPTPGIVPSAGKAIQPAIGTVDTAVEKIGDAVGDIEGVVQSVTDGTVLGEVVPPGEGE
jgi:hypothetical protein